MKVILSLIIFKSFYILTQQIPHVFEHIDTCKFEMKFDKKMKVFTVPSYITAKDENLEVLVTICGEIPKIFPNNGSCTNSCIYNKDTGTLITSRTSVLAGYEVEEASTEEILLRMQDSLKCTDTEFYEIKVRMVSSRTYKKPTLHTIGECSLEVEMIMPGYEPPCTYLLNTQQMIDLRPLKGKKILIRQDGQEFLISLCGSISSCGFDVAGCLRANESTILGTAKTQQVRFDMEKNEVKVVASIKEGRRTRNMMVVMKCDWTVPYYSNAKYIKPMTQGRNYKFEVDSSFGCVKPSSSCLIKDKDNDFMYNLSDLFKKEGYRVTIGSKYILLNICGGLSIKGSNLNNCTAQYSQVCEVDGDTYLNRGSSSSFEVIDQHFVRATFRNGHRCNENVTYTTSIDLKCSSSEKGPIFVSQENCQTKLLWETPKACPKFEKTTDTCALSTFLGGVNLSNLYAKEDKMHSFSLSQIFKYNICGDLNSNCSTYSNVTACYIDGTDQYIIGWNSPKLSYVNGNLQLKYIGERCSSKDQLSSFSINLFCSYSEKPQPTNVRRIDDCTFVASIHSSSACFSKDFEKCSYEDDEFEYDLTPLIPKDNNYEVRDENDSNVTYFLNICRPVIGQGNLLPSANSMVVKLNASRPHLWDRFTSLGKVSGPIIENGKLVIRSILGVMCRPGVLYESTIFFECSETEEHPKMLRKDDCVYSFGWKTKYACPKSKSSGMCSVTAGNITMIVSSKPVVVVDGQNTTYNLSVCSDDYDICTNNICTQNKALRQPLTKDGKMHLEFLLNNSDQCSVNSPLKKVHLTFVCGTNEEMLVERKTVNHCVVKVFVKTRQACINAIKEGPGIIERGLNIITHELKKLKSEGLANDSIPMQKVDPFLYQHEDAKVEDADKGKIRIVKAQTEKEENLDKAQQEQREKSDVETQEVQINKIEFDRVKEKQDQTAEIDKTKNQKKLDDIKNSLYQRCSDIGKGDKKFDIRNVRPSEIHGRNHIWNLNFDGSSSKCAGTICKDGYEILHFVENCPVVSYDQDVRLSYSVPEACQSTELNYDIIIYLKCNRTSHSTMVSEEGNCKVKFDYFSPETCDLLSTTQSSATLGVSVGVVLVILLGCIVSYVLYRRNYFEKCSYSPVRGSSSSLRIDHSKLL